MKSCLPVGTPVDLLMNRGSTGVELIFYPFLIDFSDTCVASRIPYGGGLRPDNRFSALKSGQTELARIPWTPS